MSGRRAMGPVSDPQWEPAEGGRFFHALLSPGSSPAISLVSIGQRFRGRQLRKVQGAGPRGVLKRASSFVSEKGTHRNWSLAGFCSFAHPAAHHISGRGEHGVLIWTPLLSLMYAACSRAGFSCPFPIAFPRNSLTTTPTFLPSYCLTFCHSFS